MVKIVKEGTPPEPPRPPWYLTPLACPRCGAVFQLDEADMASPNNRAGAWNVLTERSPHGKSEATGPCPFCHKTVTIARPPHGSQPADWQGLAKEAKII